MSEPGSPPKLSVVDDPPSTEPTERRRGPRAFVPLLLVIVALVMAWRYLEQAELNRVLTRRVATLENQLSATRAALAGEQARMNDVRSGIDGLAAQLDALRALTAEQVEAEAETEAQEAR